MPRKVTLWPSSSRVVMPMIQSFMMLLPSIHIVWRSLTDILVTPLFHSMGKILSSIQVKATENWNFCPWGERNVPGGLESVTKEWLKQVGYSTSALSEIWYPGGCYCKVIFCRFFFFLKNVAMRAKFVKHIIWSAFSQNTSNEWFETAKAHLCSV